MASARRAISPPGGKRSLRARRLTGSPERAHRSAKTRPRSTEASWSASPANVMRQSFGTASRSFARSGRSTMLASSTTIQSNGSGFPRPCLKATKSGVGPSIAWMVDASGTSAMPVLAIDSAMRWRALPVGAARPRRSPGSRRRTMSTAAAIVKVLPVPGPPVRIEKRLAHMERTASCCSGRSAVSAGNSTGSDSSGRFSAASRSRTSRS